METEGATPQPYARLNGAYWLDLPRDCRGLCGCALDGPSAQRAAAVIRYVMLGLAAGLILIGLVCVAA
ncbi:hypothetical protein [Streptomyces sp. NBC_00120]|uniref:Uncharacterized protein n=1 Tax=Streptomyces sp. NBC_00119 TaxID=2975659 RepID=A0AAU1ULM6_9ACTN|nr:hypothetical protein [Streptomyces sp. NBC_00120]MCX5321298.1 hypothetical protein [Streptomyces sp. NBC_00120]